MSQVFSHYLNSYLHCHSNQLVCLITRQCCEIYPHKTFFFMWKSLKHKTFFKEHMKFHFLWHCFDVTVVTIFLRFSWADQMTQDRMALAVVSSVVSDYSSWWIFLHGFIFPFHFCLYFTHVQSAISEPSISPMFFLSAPVSCRLFHLHV